MTTKFMFEVINLLESLHRILVLGVSEVALNIRIFIFVMLNSDDKMWSPGSNINVVVILESTLLLVVITKSSSIRHGCLTHSVLGEPKIVYTSERKDVEMGQKSMATSKCPHNIVGFCNIL